MNSSRRNSKGMNGHFQPNKGKSDVWLTPPNIIDALKPFDLDPCAAENQPWVTAAIQYTEDQDGLSKDWGNLFTWMNPPFSEISKWFEKMADHNNGIALAFARTDTEWFHKYVWDKASSLFFLRQRPHFHYITGEAAKSNSGGPIVLIGYGEVATQRLITCQLKGKLVVL